MLSKERWNKISFGFINFVNIALMILLGVIVFTTYESLKSIKNKFGHIDISFLFVAISIFFVYIFLKIKNTKSKNIVIILILIGFIIRMLWVLSIDSIPVSDYNGIYRTTYEILNGNYSEMYGTGYFARFPHLTIPVLFATFMRFLFPVNTFIAVKIVNCIFSAFGILAMYLLCKEVFKKKFYGEIGALIIALYPPVILYTAVYCNENQAIPFYILSLYLFLKYIGSEKKYLGIFLAGISLSIGNLFRMVATIIVVAFVLYIIVCCNDIILERIKKAIAIILGFAIPLMAISFGLKSIGFTEQHLWAGSEPKITNILKGTNVEGGGGWTHEDAIIPETYNFDKEKIEEVCKEIIWSRIINTPTDQLMRFYYKKYTGIWSNGEFSGAYWAEHSLDDNQMEIRISQNGIWYIKLFYLALIILSYIGLLNRKALKKFKGINLLYFIFCGYGIMFLITERQDRYTFIVCWIFIVLAMSGVNLFEKKLGESKWRSLD